MGRKAKLKKSRQQATAKSDKSNQKYSATEFVEQFEHMGYQVKVDPKLQPKTNRGNIAPELPQTRIEPQL
ncbi:MAG: hypothetical protein HC939_00895 [Pleurocapsa sp. SU_5_0]|nr:hypothetical protein [Pleurocapsa sp. SU_5_0]NJO95392.1 hypothetical protein [Pleurocapsa sp. CRU_1_2]NJR44561.1 hypothetical protein [Hyellaceae cyanobacterium CSU_1_1]